MLPSQGGANMVILHSWLNTQPDSLTVFCLSFSSEISFYTFTYHVWLTTYKIMINFGAMNWFDSCIKKLKKGIGFSATWFAPVVYCIRCVQAGAGDHRLANWYRVCKHHRATFSSSFFNFYNKDPEDFLLFKSVRYCLYQGVWGTEVR